MLTDSGGVSFIFRTKGKESHSQAGLAGGVCVWAKNTSSSFTAVGLQPSNGASGLITEDQQYLGPFAEGFIQHVFYKDHTECISTTTMIKSKFTNDIVLK